MRRKTWIKRGTARLVSRRRVRSAEEREASAAWKAAVGSSCSICPAEGGVCSGVIQGHHAISKQALKRRSLHAFLWDVRNKVDVCTFRHEQITTNAKPLPADLLPDAVWAFAADVGLTWWVERFYPSERAEVAA